MRHRVPRREDKSQRKPERPRAHAVWIAPIGKSKRGEDHQHKPGQRVDEIEADQRCQENHRGSAFFRKRRSSQRNWMAPRITEIVATGIANSTNLQTLTL